MNKSKLNEKNRTRDTETWNRLKVTRGEGGVVEGRGKD